MFEKKVALKSAAFLLFYSMKQQKTIIMIYKILTILISALTLFSACSTNFPNILPISTYRTPNWKLPYTASPEKSEIILENVDKIHRMMSYREVLLLIRKPDSITDTRKAFYGLAPKEDGFFMKYRRLISYRAIWYLSKENKGANLSDKWISIYLETDEKTVFYILKNNIVTNSVVNTEVLYSGNIN